MSIHVYIGRGKDIPMSSTYVDMEAYNLIKRTEKSMGKGTYMHKETYLKTMALSMDVSMPMETRLWRRRDVSEHTGTYLSM